MSGIVSYGAYLPFWRLQRRAITATLGAGGGGGKGARTVASYDEDTTSMGVEAGRIALRQAPAGAMPADVLFATTAPAYADKTNASAIHAALDLPTHVGAYDLVWAVRSNVAACTLADRVGGLAVLSDQRIGLPGGAEEAAGGDAAVALLFGDGPDVIAESIGGATASGEFLDRWRLPGDATSQQWEERFGEFAYAPLVEEAVTAALKSAELGAIDVDHAIVTGLHARAVKAAVRSVGFRPEAIVDDLAGTVGNSGAAHAGLLLADVLDRAGPGETIAVVQLADGVDVWLLRTTAAIATYTPARTVAESVAAGRDDLSYAQFLTWRGQLHREPPRRPEPDRPAAPPSLRTDAWKYAFVGSRDEGGFVHLPPTRVSMGSGEIDRMEPVRMADVPATIATFTVDRLAFSLSPPVVSAVIDFDGGGRFQCELTDVDPESVAIGDRVEMTFRRLFTSGGIHNYFWKARPLTARED
ncbi:MAG: OB-fold domain-containing protein [Ilumatobacteraceae bacterium]